MASAVERFDDKARATVGRYGRTTVYEGEVLRHRVYTRFIHWMVAGIDPATTSVAPGAAPAGSVQLANSAGSPGYTPMCPPPGTGHTYEFTLYYDV